MSYRIRFTMPNGRTGLWNHNYPTREDAQQAIDDRLADTGFTYTVEEVPDAPEPGSTAAHHVEILRKRVENLEAELANLKASLATAPSVPVAASEASGEGGDSDRRRLEALERYLEGNTFRRIWKTSMGYFAASTKFEDEHFNAPTIAALADKLAERETKP